MSITAAHSRPLYGSCANAGAAVLPCRPSCISRIHHANVIAFAISACHRVSTEVRVRLRDAPIEERWLKRLDLAGTLRDTGFLRLHSSGRDAPIALAWMPYRGQRALLRRAHALRGSAGSDSLRILPACLALELASAGRVQFLLSVRALVRPAAHLADAPVDGLGSRPSLCPPPLRFDRS